MAGRGGCFKRRSPLANQAALVEAASARLWSAEPRVVPCAAQTSEQYRYVSQQLELDMEQVLLKEVTITANTPTVV